MKVMQVVHLWCARGREREEVREGGREREGEERERGERGGGGKGGGKGGREREDGRPNIGILVYVMIDTRQ